MKNPLFIKSFRFAPLTSFIFFGSLTITSQAALLQSNSEEFDANASNASVPAVSGSYEDDIVDSDLVNEGQDTLDSFTSTAAFFGPSNLNDGAGGGDNTSQNAYYSNGNLPVTATFTLNVSVNTAGYDIAGINTVAGWHKNGADLANQQYEILVSLVGSPDFVSLGTVTHAPFVSADGYNTGATKIELTDDSGLIATGVDEIRFVFEEVGENFGTIFGTVYQEVDVIGAPTGGVIPGELTVTSLMDREIVQRDDSGQASFSVEGAFTGSATEIQAQAVAIAGGGTDTGWVTIDSSPTGGSYSGQLLVSEGWYQLETRILNGATEVDLVVIDQVGVGDIFITAGQSNAANFGQSTQSADDDRVSFFRAGASWADANDPPSSPAALRGNGGSPWPELGDLIAAAEGVPVGFVPIADGGSSVSSWLPASSDNYPNLQAAVQAFGVNGFKAVLWHQGEKDNANNNNNTDDLTRAEYTAVLESVIAASRADAGWNIPWGIAKVGYISQGLDEDLRGAQQDVVDNDANVFLGADTDDMIGINPANGLAWRNDGTHFSNAGLAEHAARWFSAIQDFDSQGELAIIDCTLSGNVFTIQFEGTAGKSYQLRKSLILSDDFPTIISGPIILGSSSGSLADSDADNGGTTNRAFYVVEEMP